MSIKRLLRESNPPAGMLASPVPQYEDVSTGEPGVVKGRDGAPFSMLLGPDGQPIDPSNPLEVRVRELETELQELRQLLQSGDTKVQLTGQTAPIVYDRRSETVTLIERQVRSQSVNAGRIPVPSWARAALVNLFVYGATGTFGSDKGAKLIVRMTPNPAVSTIRASQIESHAIRAVASSIWVNIGEIVSAHPTEEGYVIGSSNIYVLQTILPPYLEVVISITGSFDPGQGIDCELVIRWVN